MNNKQLDFIDLISIFSFCISLANLDENLNQSDKQELEDELAKKMNFVIQEIHSHLEDQDKKIDNILEVLNDIRGNF